MSQYSSTPGQCKYLQRRAIIEANQIACCDCPGCDDCKGFVAGCRCDEESVHDILARTRGRVVE